MSYLVLARKFRPQRFEEVVGQQAVVRTLQNALKRNRVPHALIFSGVRGVGKTTLARIMAKALNCEQGSSSSSSSPCNQCSSCQEIVNGASVDLHEVDGASNRGIQEIRELKEKIRFMPTSARYKIFIIDEVHMLTSEAFNALLKTLEEPPCHVFFMLATTELHRVPVTILSRCQRYELKRVGHKELAEHFLRLAQQENISIAIPALNLIVREAGGSVRDGLSLLDQVFSYCGEEVSEGEVVDVLGLVGNDVIAGIAASLLKGNLAESLQQLDDVYNYGMDLKRFVNDLLSWFRALVVCKVSKEPGRLLDVADDEFEQLNKTASLYSEEALSRMFHTLFEGLEKVTFASRPRFALEMAFIQAIQFCDVVPVDEIIHKLDTLLSKGSFEKKKYLDSSSSYEKRSLNTTAPTRLEDAEIDLSVNGKTDVSVGRQVSCDLENRDDKRIGKYVKEQHVAEKNNDNIPLGSVQEIDSKPVLSHGLKKKDVRQHWKDFIEYVRDRKRWMASALERAANIQLEKDDLVLHYNNSIDCRLLRNRENITPLTEFALDFFQETFVIRFEYPDANNADNDSENGVSPQQERQDLANDPLVLTALDIFNGQVGAIRVGPRFRKKIAEEEGLAEGLAADHEKK